MKGSTNVAVTRGGNGKPPPILDLDECNFDQTISDSPVPILVEFFAPWCGSCQAIAPLLDEIAKEQAGNLQIARVDVDNNPRFIVRHGILNIPTLVLFKDGQVKDQMVGLTTKTALISRLRSLD
jgi:thioredoxin